jgi:hypothetical protein
MSALEELWLWLQGTRSRTEAGPESIDAVCDLEGNQSPAVIVRNAEEALRIQRHCRYRAGPWQQK